MKKISVYSSFLLKVYSNIAKAVYIDLVYDITFNTLVASEGTICNNSMDHSFDDTLFNRINEDLEQRFNCTVPFLPPIKSERTGHDSVICKEENKSIEASARYDYLRSSGQSSLCQSPCEGMDIYLGLPFISSTQSNSTYIKIYLKSNIKIKSIVYDYTFLSLVAEVGSYVGLILGISVINIALNLNMLLIQRVKQVMIKP